MFCLKSPKLILKALFFHIFYNVTPKDRWCPTLSFLVFLFKHFCEFIMISENIVVSQFFCLSISQVSKHANLFIFTMRDLF